MDDSRSIKDQRYYQKNLNLKSTLLNVKIRSQAVDEKNTTLRTGNTTFPKEITLKLKESDNRNFNSPQMIRKSKIEVDSTPITNYYPPNFTLATVCMGSTIPYGSYKILDWIKREIYKRTHKKRPFYRDLRRKMFHSANSEECHTPSYGTFRNFQECAIRRNQRMEFNVPKYPLHQKDK